GIDLHTSTFNQALAAEYLSGGHLRRHLPNIINLYKPRQEAMLRAMDEHFPKNLTWSRPEGGMFIWVEGPKGLDMEAIYHQCVERKVAFVPGKFFYTHKGEGLETMRLNYTMIDEETIEKAIRIVAGVLGEAPIT
ncbi:MAG: aminotransferase class I/II-fold pyridoxal phosphate-dependent enzyme, partial [Anaerolineae bacterium]|nr:aminotransferase class I/II-fold pyridoxal phosphate-dependent enzyme [Anaerolineae bacterium]